MCGGVMPGCADGEEGGFWKGGRRMAWWRDGEKEAGLRGMGRCCCGWEGGEWNGRVWGRLICTVFDCVGWWVRCCCCGLLPVWKLSRVWIPTTAR